MAVNDTSSVIIQIDLEADNAIQRADELGKEIQQIKDAQKALASQNKQTSVTYTANRQALIQLQREQRAYVALANNETGSNRQLRAQLSLLTSQYDALGKEQRDNTKDGKALEVQIAAINRELLKSEGATGRFQRNVGNYASGVAGSLQSFAQATPIGGFLPQINSGITAFRQSIGFATQAVRDQQLANELLIISNNKAAESEMAQTTALEAQAELVTANTALQTKLAEVEQARAAIGTELNSVQLQRMEEEAAEVLILEQLAREQAILLAEEEARIAQEQVLTASQIELTAAENARAASEAEVAASTASAAAATEAQASATTALSTAFSATGIGALIVLIGTLVTYLGNLDTVTDTSSQIWAGFKAAINEVGRSIVNLDFGGLTTRMSQAAETAAYLKDQTQRLEDSMLNQSVKSAQTQAEVAKLQIQARNRTLDPKQREEFLRQADELDAKDLAARKSFADKAVEQQQQAITMTGNLTKYQQQQLKERGVEYALYLQNNLVKQGKVTDEQTKNLAKAYEARIQIQNEFTQRDEKRQNLSDRIADQADRKAEQLAQKELQRQQQIEKINEDRAKSQLETARAFLTTRGYELEQVNLDINKRKAMYEKYGQDTTQLEKERLSRLNQLRTKYLAEDIKAIQQYQNDIDALAVSHEDPIAKQFDTAILQNKQKVISLGQTITDIARQIAQGQTELLPVIQKAGEDLAATIEEGNNLVLEKGVALTKQQNDQKTEALNEQAAAQIESLKFEQEANDARLAMNEQLVNSYQGVSDTIINLLGKNTAAGKAAFVLSKALAVAEIAIQYERAKAAIVVAYAQRQASPATALLDSISFGAASIALGIAEAAELASLSAKEVFSIAVVGGQTISGLLDKAKGGVQYDSDGKGTVLPGYSKHDNMNARLRSGEAVIVSEAVQDPHTRNLLSAINVAYGGKDFSQGFAQGGVYGGSYMQQMNTDMASQFLYQKQLARMISSQPIYTAITEIRTANDRYTQIVDNASH